MPIIKRSAKPEESAPGPAAWVMTFCDCMTLLLCFFVLLMTFSSFDKEALRKIGGFFESRSFSWSLWSHRKVKSSMVAAVDRPTDPARDGSEKPTDWKRKLVKFAKQPLEIIQTDAFRDRKVLYIPWERLFYGKGWVLRPEGRENLRRIASFMKLVPCRVVISETGPAEEGARPDVGLERTWTVMEQFVDGEGLAADRFTISSDKAVPPERFRGKPMIQIELLAWSMYQ